MSFDYELYEYQGLEIPRKLGKMLRNYILYDN